MECLRRIQNSIDENIKVPNVTHFTEEDIDEYRSCLSEVSFRNRWPVTVYLSVIAVVGFFGNALVMAVYWQSLKQSASRIFVLAMAVVDMTINVVVLPLQIIIIRYSYNTYSEWLCRSLFASGTMLTQTSGLILVAVALDRLYRIWWPTKKHITEHQCCLINIVIFFFIVALFAGFIPVYGIFNLPSHIKGVSVKMCWYGDEYHGTPLIRIFLFVLNVVIGGSLMVMSTSYILIGLRLWKRKTPMNKSIPLAAKNLTSYTENDPVPTDVPVIAVSPVHYPFKSAISTTQTAWQKENVSNEEEHHPEITPNLRSKGPSPPAYDPNQPWKDPNLPLKDEKPPAHGNSGDEEKILLNKEGGGTSIRPHESKRRGSKVTVVSPKNTKEEGTIELDLMSTVDLDLLTESDDRVYFREIVKNDLLTQRHSRPQPVKMTETVSKHTRKVRSQTTITMSILTVFYVINWIPHCYIRLTSRSPPDWCTGYTECGRNIQGIFLRSVYVNSAVNAFVYSFCCTRFRNDFHHMLRRLFRRFSNKL